MHEKISDNNRIPAVVLNMGIPGLAINRSLKRKKIQIITIDYVSNKKYYMVDIGNRY